MGPCILSGGRFERVSSSYLLLSWCSAGHEGMTTMSHPLWVFVVGTTICIPTFLLSTRIAPDDLVEFLRWVALTWFQTWREPTGEPLLWCILLGHQAFNSCQLKGFSIKPLKVKLIAGEQKATGILCWVRIFQRAPQRDRLT